MLDLIRLSEPGEEEGAKAGWRNCFPSPPNGRSSRCARQGLSRGAKGHIVLLSQGRGGLSLPSRDKHFDLPAPILLSFLPTNQLPNRVCLSHARPSLLRPCPGPGSPAGTHMKVLPAENPHGTESCPHRSPGPGSLHTGPRKLGRDPPSSGGKNSPEPQKRGASQRTARPLGRWAARPWHINGESSPAQEHLGPHCAAPAPGTGLFERGKRCLEQHFVFVGPVEGKQDPFPAHWQKSES